MKERLFLYSGTVIGLIPKICEALEAWLEGQHIQMEITRKELKSQSYYEFGNSEQETNELDF